MDSEPELLVERLLGFHIFNIEDWLDSGVHGDFLLPRSR